MKAKIKNIDLMKVKDNENTYYGFSQEWYKDIWQQKAGCGATVASSIINYYNQIDNFKEVEIADAVKIMEELWYYLLPTYYGLNSVKLFYDGEVIDFYGEKLYIMETPGHTVGSICILMGNVMFSGDTLFRMSIGIHILPTVCPGVSII